MSDFSIEVDRTSVSVRITWAALAKWIALGFALFLGSDSPVR
jgi:hypothetical protein